jgi:hypothetical protein
MNILDYYKQLEGGIVLKASIGEDGFPTFIIKLKTGTLVKAEVSMDEEGNGSGFVFISNWVRKEG